MAKRRQSSNNLPKSQRPTKGRSLVTPPSRTIATTSRARVQKRRPHQPLRRSKRLQQRLSTSPSQPRLKGKPNSQRYLPSTPSETQIESSQTLICPRGQKRRRENTGFESLKRRRTDHATDLGVDTPVDPIDHWRRAGFCWPQGEWRKINMDNTVLNKLLAKTKSSSSLSRKRSNSALPTDRSAMSGQDVMDNKSALYRDPRYMAWLGKENCTDSDAVVEKNKLLIAQLLSVNYPIPEKSLFDDDIFRVTCRKLVGQSETRVIRDILLLMVPSAETLTTHGEEKLACLAESNNDGWNNSIPLTKSRPQPDYAVGFCREAFTEEQLFRLRPFLGAPNGLSFFRATESMYLPFLTCEVKCGSSALDIADRQNAHSIALAMRGVVSLFQLVKREQEINREIIAFSVSLDHRNVRIYGHYPVIDGRSTIYYRHMIRSFDFTDLDGRDKWTTMMFTLSVYRTWMQPHLDRLRSVIDAIPPGVDVAQESEQNFSDTTGLSQQLGNYNMAAPVDSSSSQCDSNQSQLLRQGTPATSVTQDLVRGRPTKAKRGRHTRY